MSIVVGQHKRYFMGFFCVYVCVCGCVFVNLLFCSVTSCLVFFFKFVFFDLGFGFVVFFCFFPLFLRKRKFMNLNG